MTLPNLNKILDRYEQQLGFVTLPSQFELLNGFSFYCGWEQSSTLKRANHARYYFNHVIGLPEKNGQPKPMFDYEQSLFNELQNHKFLWIKKVTELGVTEFMLRFMAWLCFQVSKKNLQFSNYQMCIITGPRIELAIELIGRLKGLFTEKHIWFDTRRQPSNLMVFTSRRTRRITWTQCEDSRM
jgi:hypothetical protein